MRSLLLILLAGVAFPCAPIRRRFACATRRWRRWIGAPAAIDRFVPQANRFSAGSPSAQITFSPGKGFAAILDRESTRAPRTAL